MKIVLCTIALILLAGSGFGYWFLLTEIYALQTVISEARDEASLVARQDALTRATNTLLNDSQPLQAELDGYLTHDADIVSVIEALEGAAARENVALSVVSTKVGNSTWQKHEPVRAVMTGRGAFVDLVAFLTALEHFPLAARLESFSMDASADGWLGTFEVTLIKQKASL